MGSGRAIRQSAGTDRGARYDRVTEQLIAVAAVLSPLDRTPARVRLFQAGELSSP
jgi:hypothetical protein